jgi:hypothetical protein
MIQNPCKGLSSVPYLPLHVLAQVPSLALGSTVPVGAACARLLGHDSHNAELKRVLELVWICAEYHWQPISLKAADSQASRSATRVALFVSVRHCALKA